jgi:hypothetical protein
VPGTTITTHEDAEEGRRDIRMSLSQLGRSVLRGQRITAWLHDDGAVTGYLAGMDDDTWFILQPDGERVRQYLVPIGSSLVLEIHTERTYDLEPQKREMEKIIIHLRTWFSKNVFA